MSHTLELASIEHGTIDGYRAGCHGSRNSCGAPYSCAEVYTRFQGDWGFRRRVEAGETPAAIIEAEIADAAAVRERDKAAALAAKRSAAADHAKRAARKTTPRKPKEVKPPRVTLATQIGDDVKRLHAEGLSDVAIARELGVRVESVHYVRNRQLQLPRNVRARAARVPSARELRNARVVELHAAGKTDGEIAVELGIKRAAANQIRRRLGLKVNPEPAAVRTVTPRRARAPRREVAGCGTNASYARGCRCDACCEARRTYHREYVKRRREEGAKEYHGTAYGYQLGCRARSACPATPSCSDASLAAERARRRTAGIPPKELVDATPVRAHVLDLNSSGLTYQHIAEAAGVPFSAVKSLMFRRGAERPRAEQLLAERAAAILAVKFEEKAA